MSTADDSTDAAHSDLLRTVGEQLGDQAAELVVRAADAITARYVADRHVIGVALLAGSEVFSGVNLDTGIGRAAVCAEAVAVGAAVMAGNDPFELVVAVRHPKPGEPQQHQIVPPCGPCRELLLDYAPSCRVIVPDANDLLVIVPVRGLLPHRYRSSRPAFAGLLDGVTP